MDFGAVEPKTLGKLKLQLPPDPPENKKVLKGKPIKKPRLYLGCAKWGRKEWIGKIYPKGIKEADFLEEYGRHYNSIELNATHYQIYGAETIRKWADKIPRKDFRFCPKIAQSISHYSTLVNAGAKTTAFLEGVLAFGPQLGPIFLQLSDRFSPKRRDNLYKYLESLPTDLSFFTEVRHPDWFSDPVISREYFSTLRQLKIGAVITDTAGRRDCAHMHLTTPSTFIRFVGNSLHPTDYKRIDDWVHRIHTWLQQGIKEVCFFMHMHDEARSPELTVYFADKMKAICDIDVQRPQFVQ